MTPQQIAHEEFLVGKEAELRAQRRQEKAKAEAGPQREDEATFARQALSRLGCGHGSRFLRSPWRVLEDGPCCLLAATSISQTDTHLRTLLEDLGALLATHPWARGIVNYFSEPSAAAKQRLRTATQSTHPRLASSFVPGFKTLFWQTVLRPTTIAAFTHLFLFDSDMVVRPSEFNLVGLLRVGEAVNASLIQPSPYGGGAGMYALGHPRCPESDACHCSPQPESECAVCRQPVIEVKVPLFTRTAWAAVYDEFLGLVPSTSLTGDKMMDLTWCDSDAPHALSTPGTSGCSSAAPRLYYLSSAASRAPSQVWSDRPEGARLLPALDRPWQAASVVHCTGGDGVCCELRHADPPPQPPDN